MMTDTSITPVPGLADDYRFHLDIILQVTGITEEEFYSSRGYPAPYYRAIVARSLREKGYSTANIGSCIHRDHSTVIHGLRSLKDALDNPTFGTIKRIWDEYQALKLTMTEQEGPQPAKIEEMARQFVGNHCRRRCLSCYIPADNCRYRQDERVFLAGAKAQLDLLKSTVQKLRELTSQCSLICGRADMQETLATIEGELSNAE